MVDDTKKKQKVVHTQDDLLNNDPFPDYVITNNPFERKMDKVNNKKREIDIQSSDIDNKHQNIMSESVQNEQKIHDYPMIKATLGEFRKDELKLSKDKLRQKKSFCRLFETRLNNVPGNKETVSISVIAEIESTQGKNISATKKPHGPFTVKKPVHMSKMDVYKFAMYTLFKQGFILLSAQRIIKIGCQIIKLDKKQFKHHKMGKLRLESYLLNKQRPIKSNGINTCVIDYVWDQVRGQRGFKTYTYEKLKSEIYENVPEGDMISTEELINWANDCHDNVSIHAFDCRYRKFISHSKNCSNITLVYIVKIIIVILLQMRNSRLWPVRRTKGDVIIC